MPSRFLGDVSSDKTNPASGSKDNANFFPVINRNGSVGSQTGTDSDSPTYWSSQQNNRSSSLSRSVSTTRDSLLRLPSIDRSKTNSICSYASSNISSVTASSRSNASKMPHVNGDTLRHALHNGTRDNSDRIESITPQYNDHNSSHNSPLKNERKRNSGSDDRHSAAVDIKLPDIFSCKSSSIGSPIQSPSPTFRHHGRTTKKKSASLQDLAGALRREESVLSENYKNFSRSPNSCLTLESQGFHRADNSTIQVRSSMPTPVLFPMRESESRMSRKSKGSVKRKDKQNRRENENVLKENDFKEVIEKLEAFSSVDNCEDNALVLGKPNLQKVREETEVDQYIYANGYDHPSKSRKGRKRAQSEDRRSAKVH